MKYIQSLERPYKLREGENVSFTLSDGTVYNGYVAKGSGFYISLNCGDNEELFRELEIHKDSFMQVTVGYAPRGNWPEARSLEDLEKVLDALLKVHKPEETDEKPKPPSEWDWLLG